jgi:hypothetical protein
LAPTSPSASRTIDTANEDRDAVRTVCGWVHLRLASNHISSRLRRDAPVIPYKLEESR